MKDRAPIFISAVTDELRTARDVVATTLRKLGHEVVYQPTFATLPGDLPSRLRELIQKSAAVIQLVGHRFGTELPRKESPLHWQSYAQYEAIWAREQGKEVFYLILTKTFITDPCDLESPDFAGQQQSYRSGIERDDHVRHYIQDEKDLIIKVHEMRPELERCSPQAPADPLDQPLTRRQFADILGTLPLTVAEVAGSAGREDESQSLQRAYAILEKKHRLPTHTLKAHLPGLLNQLASNPDTSMLDRARTAYAKGERESAIDLALRAHVESIQMLTHDQRRSAREALELAGLACKAGLQYEKAIIYLRQAEAFTDRGFNPAPWARIQHALAMVLYDLGHYRQMHEVIEGALEERLQILGANNRETLTSRNNLGLALRGLGRYSEAEEEHRVTAEIRGKVLGADDADTLWSLNNLSNTLRAQSRFEEAESLQRDVLERRQRTLEADHPDILVSRDNLALCRRLLGHACEAEQEHRAVLEARIRVLTENHPDTFWSRFNLACALLDQGQYEEAEAQFGLVEIGRAAVLGPNHPETLKSRLFQGITRFHMGQKQDAGRLIERALEALRHVLAPDHPDIAGYEHLWQRLK